MPLLDPVAEGLCDEALLGEEGLAPEFRGDDVDGVHGAAAARDVADEEGGGRGEGLVGGELLGDGELGGGHGGEAVIFFCGRGGGGVGSAGCSGRQW